MLVCGVHAFVYVGPTCVRVCVCACSLCVRCFRERACVRARVCERA